MWRAHHNVCLELHGLDVDFDTIFSLKLVGHFGCVNGRHGPGGPFLPAGKVDELDVFSHKEYRSMIDEQISTTE